jgi:hypothetical protein
MFEMLDYNDKNFFHNSGSYFVIMAILLVFYSVSKTINSMAVTYASLVPDSDAAEKLGIGIYVHEESYLPIRLLVVW